MNIALCYESVLPTRGGCETYIATLARRLAADGHEVHLYACRWDPTVLPPQVRYHAIRMAGSLRFLRPWFFSSACQKALREARHDLTVGFDKICGVDVVYPQGGLYAATAQHNLLKYRHCWQRRLVGLLKAFDPAHRSYIALEKRQYRGANRPLVVAISEMVYQHFQEYCGYSTEDLRLVRLAPNTERFDETDRPRRRQEWRHAWVISPEMTVGLFAGLNYRLKGLEPLLHAVRLLQEPNFRLLVAGSSYTADFQRLARKLGVARQVRFLGYCADMRNCYFAADFFVHPTFYDPCSHVVLEAMSCGLPVITSRYNGASEMLHPPREGLVIRDPHDHAELAQALRHYLDPAQRSPAGQAARRTAAQWTFEQHYRQLLGVFTEAASRKRAA
jgi:UDP-glucose:(heptosyl)LPS alpha-1,3-glucosyltransferase